MPQAITQRRCASIGCDNPATGGCGGFCQVCHDTLSAHGQLPDWPEQRQDHIGQNGNTGDHYDAENAADILGRARTHLRNRATTYDAAHGERSMAKAVAIFNAAGGPPLSERDGWRFMVCLKMARATQPGHNPDDYEDMAAYAALYGEASRGPFNGG